LRERRRNSLSIAPILGPEDIDAVCMTRMLRARGCLDASAQVIEVSAASCGTGQLGDSFRFS